MGSQPHFQLSEALERPVTVKQMLAGLLLLWILTALGPQLPTIGNLGDQPLGITDLVSKVRDELAQAQRNLEKDGRLALFEIEEMEMEINYVVHAGREAKIEVVGVGGGTSTSSEKVQKLRLQWKTLPPRSASAPTPGQTGAVTRHVVVGGHPASATAPTKP